MSWLQAHLVLDKALAPEAEALFEALGALSVTLEDAADEPMLEPPPGATPLWRRTRITGLFEAERDRDELRRQIEQALAGDHHLELEELADQPWERAWLEHFRPMRFGERLWVCPSGQQVTEEDALVMELDPGLAFGTGTHPTTALCLEWLEGTELAGKRVIDYGCGSGILSVAALKLGAADVIAVDHDAQALLATRENARRNGVETGLRAVSSREPLEVTADLLVANILANVLVDLAPKLAPLLRRGGELVLSGILEHQAAAVEAAYRPWIGFEPAARQGEWYRLQGRRT